MIRAILYVFTAQISIGISVNMAFAQVEDINDSLVITGVIWDAESYEPIPYANVYTTKKGTFTNTNGEYRILVIKGDTLTVSHISYHSQKSVISGRSENQFFWLKPLINSLKEVIISPLPNESDMKGILLQTSTKIPPQTMRAKQNLQKIQGMYLRGYKTEMNSLDNYLNYMKGPQDVSIFSTNPFRGISGVRKNIKRK